MCVRKITFSSWVDIGHRAYFERSLPPINIFKAVFSIVIYFIVNGIGDRILLNVFDTFYKCLIGIRGICDFSNYLLNILLEFFPFFF